MFRLKKNVRSSRRFGIWNILTNHKAVTRRMLDHGNKLIKDGKEDDYPQQVGELVAKSPIATLCLQRRIQYVCGMDLQGGEDIQISEKYTLSDIHEDIVSDFERLDRVALEVIPSLNGQTVDVNYLEVEKCRYMPIRDEDDGFEWIVYDPKMGSGERSKKEERQYLRIYKSPESFASERFEDYDDKHPYGGHIIWYNRTNYVNRIYSRPHFMAAENWINTDGKVGEIFDAASENGFFLGGIITFKGNPDEPILDEDGEVTGYLGDAVNDWLTSAFAGSENTNSLMAYWDNTPEGNGKPEIEPWPVSPFQTQFLEADPLISKKIAQSFAVPPILLPEAMPGRLGESQEYMNAQLFLNSITEFRRNTLLREIYEKVKEVTGQNVDLVIRPVVSTIGMTPEVFAMLPKEEQAAIISRRFGIDVEPEQLKDYAQRNQADQPGTDTVLD